MLKTKKAEIKLGKNVISEKVIGITVYLPEKEKKNVTPMSWIIQPSVYIKAREGEIIPYEISLWREFQIKKIRKESVLIEYYEPAFFSGKKTVKPMRSYVIRKKKRGPVKKSCVTLCFEHIQEDAEVIRQPRNCFFENLRGKK